LFQALRVFISVFLLPDDGERLQRDCNLLAGQGVRLFLHREHLRQKLVSRVVLALADPQKSEIVFGRDPLEYAERTRFVEDPQRFCEALSSPSVFVLAARASSA